MAICMFTILKIFTWRMRDYERDYKKLHGVRLSLMGSLRPGFQTKWLSLSLCISDMLTECQHVFDVAPGAGLLCGVPGALLLLWLSSVALSHCSPSALNSNSWGEKIQLTQLGSYFCLWFKQPWPGTWCCAYGAHAYTWRSFSEKEKWMWTRQIPKVTVLLKESNI